ncbi:D-alanyl-D-alanine carboxypeptidase family protein [Microbacterium murale]|uniref:Peptidase S11 D-alanyl-D-alanine carboxypeptidase A N-terminal domain-containing protein n=1 Tax=Microbacterium murale TaxID=1081040 RepID=A0ABQ1RCN5_9MICO|nr:D-alanyl-D-alanine carboxypeptidase [Microbacterium murale]GGD63988.1 hypothetical protein GCM10007269_04080 [Microbacterium murale]
MTIDDATPETGTLTRRELRAGTGATETVRPPALPFSDTASTSAPDAADLDPVTDAVLAADEPTASAASTVQWADRNQPATVFTWLDVDTVEESTRPADLDRITMRETGPDLLADARLRPTLLRARWLVPIVAVAALVLAYAATVLLWPLHEVPPTVEAVEFETVAAQIAAPAWPVAGSAGVGIAGLSSVTSSADAVSIASVTKVVTALMVLDRMPLQLGEQGPEFAFSYSDSVEYWDYRRADQSALDVPVGGVLTEYQLLQGTLLGSANNYVDRLAREIWGSDASFADAAARWLADRGLSGITVVTPSGFDEGNVATPEALLQLGERAMQNPVFAEIVGTVSVDIPGAGVVTNTNGMLADPGVVGIKTGTLVGWSMLTAKDVTIGDTTVHLYAAVLNQGDDAERLAVTRSLFADAEAALEAMAPAVPSGTVVGTVDTLWGASVDLVTDEDATVLLWNGAAAGASATLALGDEEQRDAGDEAGTLSVSGPLDAVDVGVSLSDELSGPSPWWRLTHPFELLGVVAG